MLNMLWSEVTGLEDLGFVADELKMWIKDVI